MRDETVTLGKLREAVARFSQERDWRQFHTEKNLAMSIAIEAAELMELFQWSEGRAGLEIERRKLSHELADVVIYCLIMSDVAGIDLAAAVEEKMEINARKYPVEKPWGRNT